MRYRYLDDFRRGISVFAIFSYGIAVLGTPQCPPHFQNQRGASTLQNREITVLMSELHFNPILFSCRGKTRDLQ